MWCWITWHRPTELSPTRKKSSRCAPHGTIPGPVKLRDFGYKVVEQTDSAATVTYSGQRCAPEERTTGGPKGTDYGNGTTIVEEAPVYGNRRGLLGRGEIL